MAILHHYAPVVEGAGIDEAYFDLSFTGSYDRAADLARQIKAAILAQERLTASIGIGPNKMVAKIASDFQKPDGLTLVTPGEAEDFLAPLAVRKIPGIGPKTEQSLARLGIKTVKDLKRFTPEELYEKFGKWGPSLYERIRGRHDSPLVTSVGAQIRGGAGDLCPRHPGPGVHLLPPLGAVPGGASAFYRRGLPHLPHRGGHGALRRLRYLLPLPHPGGARRLAAPLNL